MVLPNSGSVSCSKCSSKPHKRLTNLLRSLASPADDSVPVSELELVVVTPLELPGTVRFVMTLNGMLEETASVLFSVVESLCCR